MRLILLWILAFCSFTLYAQRDTLYFTPKWKRGDQRKVRFNIHEKNFEDNKLTVDTSYYYAATYKVKVEDDTSYQLLVNAPSLALNSIFSTYEMVGAKYRGFRDIALLYQVDKKNGSFQLLNYNESKAYLDKSMLDLEALFTKMIPNEAEMATQMLEPIKQLISTEEGVNAFMHDFIHFIQYPYGKSFILGDTLELKSKILNPMNQSDTIVQAELYYATKGNYANYNITNVQIINTHVLQQFLTEMIDTTQINLEQDTTSKLSDIKVPNMDLNSQLKVEFNASTSWPKYARQKSKVVIRNRKIEKVVNYTFQEL